ncbi:MAG: hypothetical protein ACK45R_01440 [Candidatus Kapaibacterium sp.]|jgi:hypothetical protein
MDFFDAYEEVYSAVERFVEHNGRVPASVSVSPALYSWLQSMKKEAVADPAEEPSDAQMLSTRFGPITLVIDELLSPHEILVE